MAHTICGIDLGSFSVKLAFFEVGFRSSKFRGVVEVPVPEGEGPLIERQLDVVKEELSRVAGEVTPYLAVPGDQLSVRVLELPFTDPRKIDQVVGYELEGQIVNAIEDVVFDHLVVSQKPEGSTVLAVATKRDDLAALIAAAEGGHGIQPRALYAAPVIYRTLLPAAPVARREPGEEEAAPPCQAVLDDTQLYPRASLACDRASAAGFDSLDTMINIMQNPQTSVLPDDPRYKVFQSLRPLTINKGELAKLAYTGSPRIYRIVATGESGRVKKKITAIVDTGRTLDNPLTLNPASEQAAGVLQYWREE